MDYHLTSEVQKYMEKDVNSLLISMNIHYHLYKDSYLYKYPIIKVKYEEIEEYSKCRNEVIVTEINNDDELKRLNDVKVKIIGIIFGDEFNDEVDILPDNIRILIFGEKFNKRIKAKLPETLKILKSPNVICHYSFLMPKN